MNRLKKNETTIGWSAAERERRLPIIQMIFNELDQNFATNVDGDRLPKRTVTNILKKHKNTYTWLNRRIIHHFFRKRTSSNKQIMETTDDDSSTKKTQQMESKDENLDDNWRKWNLPLNHSDPVLKIKIPSSIPSDEPLPPLTRSDMCLENLLYPLSKEQFLEHCFRKKAVHIDSSNNVTRDGRMNDLTEGMFRLDTRKIIEETSSDNIFVWLVDKSPLSSKKDGPQKLVQSIQMEDPNSAFQLHTIGNHALYFRAPPDVEQPLVSQMLASTGLGCGQYDPSGCQTTTMGHGEVETFVGTEGHFTNWHTDFQENFTVQLSGSKKWKLKQCTVKHPLRGCTPHYGKVAGVVENQLKLARLSDKTFSFDHPNDSNSYGNIEEVIMNTGDILYFPAGMWHSVETITPGISINVSLMSTNYADIVTKALHHYLLTHDEWRESISTLSSSCQSNTNAIGLVPVMEKLKSLLQKLPQITEKLVTNNFQESIIPPVLRHPPKFQHMNDDVVENEDFGSDESNSDPMDETEQYTSENDEGDCSNEELMDEMENDNSLLDHDEHKNDSENEEGLVRIETGSFQSPNEWAQEEEKMISQYLENGSTLLINPLASLIPMKEIISYYESATTLHQQQHRGGGNLDNEYMLNVNFGGHDNFQSSIRVVLVDTSPNKILAKISYKKRNMNEREIQPKNMFETTNDESINTLRCLLYYGLYTFGIKNNDERVA